LFVYLFVSSSSPTLCSSLSPSLSLSLPLPQTTTASTTTSTTAHSTQLSLRKGEYEIDSINSVEDTKGNNGVQGVMVVTNLRVWWAAHKDPRTNLSIGLDCISGVYAKSVTSRLKGDTQALYVMTKYNKTRYEFIFTSLVKGSPRLFTTIQAVYKAFNSTRLYRDLKLRGAIVKAHKLLLLPDEEICSQTGGVWNLSADQGNLGKLYITNIRLVWHADLAENFNVSIPFLQILSVTLRNSKFGKALVIETTYESGHYMLGFRIDPEEKLTEVNQEVLRFHEVYTKKPNFGVKFRSEDKPSAMSELKIDRKMDDLEIVAHENPNFNAVAAYFADGGAAHNSETSQPVYNEELGLAIEKLPDGLTVQQLWNV
jgi:Bardet-Biedl syndrome 5 protein